MSEVEDYDDGPKGDEMEQDSDDAASIGSHSEQDVEEQKQHDSEVGSDVASEPASAPQSPSGSEGGQQSEDEVHISEQEEYEQSDKEDAHSDKNEEQSGKEDRESDVDGERDDDEDQELAQDVESDKEDNSDREDEQSSDRDEQQEEKECEDDDNRNKEDSDREEYVPEIHIDSGDEYNDRESINKNSDDDDDRQSNSGSEVERDEGSDGEKGSDQDEANRLQITDANSDAEENNDAGSEDERNSVISGRESPIEETPQSPTSPPDSDDEEKETKAESDDEEAPSSPVPLEDKMVISTEEIEKAENEAKSDSDSESDSDESKVGELIADIFGKSDDEEEEFEGFGEEDLAAVKQKKEKRKKAAKALSDSEEEVEVEEKENDEIREAEETEELPPLTVKTENSETAPKKVIQPVSDDDSDDDGLRKMREDFISDFDLMMQKKKEENQRKRKRKDVDIINDSDDLIAEIILQMRQAADEDRDLNKQRKAATKKLKILPLVMSQLKKQDLKMAFLDQGVLNVMADWLSPLPDRSLPHFQIREGMIRRLGEFPVIDQSLLKCSGVGRALMYLYKHPKETKENRERCGKLITEWARPIFNLTTNFHSLTKEEREQRDFEHLPRKRKSRMESGEEEEKEKAGAKKDIEKVMSSEEKSLRPGEKGWIARARVPAPSMRDYVVRPKWNVEIEIGRGPAKKPLNRYERHLRTIMEKKKLKKAQRAVTISIEGRKMAI